MDNSPQPPVTISPGTEGAVRRREVTLRVLAAADLGGDPGGGPRAVDRRRFPEVMAEMAPKAEVAVKNHLGSGDKELTCSLRFGSLEEFSPDAILGAVPELAGLGEARRLVQSCLARETDPAELAGALPRLFGGTEIAAQIEAGLATEGAASGATGPAPAEASGGGVDALLSQVDVPDAATPEHTPASLADLLVATAIPARAGMDAAEEERLKRYLREIDLRLTRQLTAITDAGSVRSLEAAWRGLAFLADRADRRGGIRLETLAAGKRDFLGSFYERVFQPEYDGRSEVPLSLVVAAYAFDRSPADLDLLQTAGRMAGSLGTPIVTAIGPEFWGVRQPRLLATLPDLVRRSREPAYLKWNRFRGEEESRWLSVAVNRFLLREAWGGESTPVASFEWQGDATKARPLWGSGAWALGAVAAQGFAAEGLRLPMAGTGPPVLLEELPRLPAATGKEETEWYPLEVRFGDERTLELSQTGLAPLVARGDADQAFFPSVPTFHAPKMYDQEEASRASFLAATLPYQLFAGLASHALQEIAGEVPPGSPPEEITRVFQSGLLAFLANGEEHPSEEEVQVEVSANEEFGGRLDVTVRLRPQFEIYGGEVDLVLGTAVDA